jgi:hypothetical protein
VVNVHALVAVGVNGEGHREITNRVPEAAVLDRGSVVLMAEGVRP